MLRKLSVLTCFLVACIGIFSCQDIKRYNFDIAVFVPIYKIPNIRNIVSDKSIFYENPHVNALYTRPEFETILSNLSQPGMGIIEGSDFLQWPMLQSIYTFYVPEGYSPAKEVFDSVSDMIKNNDYNVQLYDSGATITSNTSPSVYQIKNFGQDTPIDVDDDSYIFRCSSWNAQTNAKPNTDYVRLVEKEKPVGLSFAFQSLDVRTFYNQPVNYHAEDYAYTDIIGVGINTILFLPYEKLI